MGKANDVSYVCALSTPLSLSERSYVIERDSEAVKASSITAKNLVALEKKNKCWSRFPQTQRDQ